MDLIGRHIRSLVALLVAAGGVCLLAVVAMTCISVIGRAFTPFGPIRGDFELVEIGVGFAVFCFLPWCHFWRGNATVDLFESFFGQRLNRILDLIADLLILAVATVLAWRIWAGLLEKLRYQETTMILQFPVWIAYSLCLVGAAGFVVVAVFCVMRSTVRLRIG